MIVLVTGCAGFIGSALSRLLASEGHDVVGLDNINDAYDPRLKQWRLAGLRKLQTFTWHPGDITDRDSLEALFSKYEFDAVVNLAARAGVRQSTLDPWAYYATNLTGVLNLLAQCRKARTGKIIQASTSSVYGANKVPFGEDQPTERPLSPYAASKKAAEELCYAFSHLYGLDITVLRFFTVYGPAGRPDMSIFRFIKWITENETVTLYGDGTQQRDFTYVDDVAVGLRNALQFHSGYEVINLGSDRPVALNDVISCIEQRVGKKAAIKQMPADPTDVRATWADIKKARRLLHWGPQTTIEEGVERAVTWYMDNRDWARELRL